MHLCGAALTEEEAAPRLQKLCAQRVRVYNYYAASDEVLISGFLLASGGNRALGSGPLRTPLPNLTSLDAEPYFSSTVKRP